MAIKAVVYQSSTGHTKRYAEAFAQKAQLPLYDSIKAHKQLQKGDEIVYFGWLMAGKIQGYEKAWGKFETRAVCSVGLYPDSERFRSYVARNNILIDTAYYHLRGGIKPDELKGSARILMRIMMRQIEKKQQTGKQITDEEQQMFAAYHEKADFVDLDTLSPVLQWYRDFCAQEA